jgi:hypothetical protein
MQRIQSYRDLRKEKKLNIHDEIESIFVSYFRWKKSLVRRNILPTNAEWLRLAADSPRLFEALRRLYVEWLGLPDPYFRVTFQNDTTEPIIVAKLQYNAKYVKSYKALLFGSVEKPPYLIQLREGKHVEEFHPPIVVKPKSTETISLLIRLERPRPGALYNVDMTYVSADGKHKVKLPRFGILFWRGKVDLDPDLETPP